MITGTGWIKYSILFQSKIFAPTTDCTQTSRSQSFLWFLPFIKVSVHKVISEAVSLCCKSKLLHGAVQSWTEHLCHKAKLTLYEVTSLCSWWSDIHCKSSRIRVESFSLWVVSEDSNCAIFFKVSSWNISTKPEVDMYKSQILHTHSRIPQSRMVLISGECACWNL